MRQTASGPAPQTPTIDPFRGDTGGGTARRLGALLEERRRVNLAVVPEDVGVSSVTEDRACPGRFAASATGRPRGAKARGAGGGGRGARTEERRSPHTPARGVLTVSAGFLSGDDAKRAEQGSPTAAGGFTPVWRRPGPPLPPAEAGAVSTASTAST
jgi:hypothetical protein